MELEACLPADLRGATIAKIRAGLSGAGVYRVDADGRALVLKIDPPGGTSAEWETKVAILHAASAAGVAPRVVHVDHERRAVVSELVEDRGLVPRLMTPATRAETIALVGETLRRVHEVPVPPTAVPRDPIGLLARISRGIAHLPKPPFVAEAITRMLAEPMPDGGALVLSHNDVNPSNILFDGARVVLLDWDLAGPSNRDYDFATIAVFLRMDDAASATLVGGPLSPRFHYDRRLVAVACGTIFLHIAHAAGHAGDATDDGELLEAAYLRMREGAIDVGSPTGQWAFGLALLRQSARL